MTDSERFANLFQGRTDAYGTEHGGKADGAPPITAHLAGTTDPIGVYPLRDDLTVWWGCTDLDYVDEPDDAFALKTVLAAMGLKAWVEVSRSKGFHVWVFAAQPVPAATMRNALLAAHQLAEIPAREVNPKQTSLDGLKGYGNYVRLPYPGAFGLASGLTVNERRIVIANDRTPIDVYDFIDRASANRATQAELDAAAELYLPPPMPKTVTIDDEPQVSSSITDKLSKPAYLAFRYGPRPGHDRSSSLMRLAHFCREDGLEPGEALAVVRDLDRRVGKFVDRPDCETQLAAIITRAYE